MDLKRATLVRVAKQSVTLFYNVDQINNFIVWYCVFHNCLLYLTSVYCTLLFT